MYYAVTEGRQQYITYSAVGCSDRVKYLLLNTPCYSSLSVVNH